MKGTRGATLRIRAGMHSCRTESLLPTASMDTAGDAVSPRLVRLLALAHRWHKLIDGGKVENQSEIARLVGLTRARVTQIMNLRWLNPRLQEQILAQADPDGAVSPRFLRRLSSMSLWAEQLNWGREDEQHQGEALSAN